MRIALWQTVPQMDIDQALKGLNCALAEAKGAGTDVLVTPEMFLGGYNIGAEKCAEHAGIAEDALEAVKQMCKRYGISVVVGLALPNAQRPFNAAVAIDANGDEVARYHKTHLYGDVDRRQFSAGDTVSHVFDLAGWRVGLVARRGRLLLHWPMRAFRKSCCPTAPAQRQKLCVPNSAPASLFSTGYRRAI